MAKTDILHIRVEPDVKENVDFILSKLGLSMADAVNIFLRQVQYSNGLPFEVKLPLQYNLETLEAMEEARKISKEGKGFDNVDDLLKDLKSE